MDNPSTPIENIYESYTGNTPTQNCYNSTGQQTCISSNNSNNNSISSKVKNTIVDCQGQPLDLLQPMETSFIEFLESVRDEALQSGCNISDLEDNIVRLVQSGDTYNQMRAVITNLMTRNKSLDLSLTEAITERDDYQSQGRQLRYEMELMKSQLDFCVKENDYNSQLAEEEKIIAIEKVGKAKEKERFTLEQENTQLAYEAERLKSEASIVEMKERELIKQCFEQLSTANNKIENLHEESFLRESTNKQLEEKIQQLTDAVKQMHRNQMKLEDENIQLKGHLFNSQDVQSKMLQHVHNLECEHEEWREMLGDTQKELQQLQIRTETFQTHPFPSLSTEIASALQLDANMPTNCTMQTNSANSNRSSSSSSAAVIHSPPHNSSDSDSFIFIDEPIKLKKRENTPVLKTRFKQNSTKKVSFLQLQQDEKFSDTNNDSTNSPEDDLLLLPPKKFADPIMKTMKRPLTPEMPRKNFRTPKRFGESENVRLVKNVEGSVQLEKWRQLAISNDAVINIGPGIRKKLHKTHASSAENLTSLFKDDNLTPTHSNLSFSNDLKLSTRNINPSATTNNQLKHSNSFITNFTSAIGEYLKW